MTATKTAKPNGIHHFAICTADIKRQIAFFTDVLGMELVALYWMHGVEGAWHGFLKLNEQSSIAFVQTPKVGQIPSVIGRTHSGNAGGPCAPGAMQHVAFNVDTEADLLAMRDRIRSRGVEVLGHIDHGFCKSIYFAGPENLTLEVSTSEGLPIDAEAWIDPEVVALAGISAEELARFKSPEAYAPPARPVAQPAFDAAQPHMAYPPKVYQALFGTSDADIFARMSDTTPPVRPAG
jgi:catechol 2,3-dioxygenase-like lactoylglutathione lyase family enzyme